MKRLRLAAIIIMVLVCRGAAFSGPMPAAVSNKNLRVELDQKPFALRIMDSSGKILLQTEGRIAFTTVRDQSSPFAKGKAEPWTEVSELANLEIQNNQIQAELSAQAGSKALVRLKIFFLNYASLRVETEVLNQPQVNRLRIKFLSALDDLYYGMGERYNTAQQKGNLVYNWTQEGCMLGCNNTVVTYFPVPFYLNPRGYGFLLDDTHYSEFDFGKTDPGIFALTNFNRQMNLMIFSGPSPLEIIEHYTDYTGRIKVPPPWAFGVWNAADEGSPRAREVARVSRQEKIPTSAIWSEDWAWPSKGFLSLMIDQTFQWELNRKRYPDYEQVAQELHRDGFRFLGYFTPYIGARSQIFRQAGKYMAQSPLGKPAVFSWLFNKVAEPDLTNPEAREWWQKTFFQKALDYGIDGWMHDFSEYTPTWVKFADGRDGWAVHNDYPVLWAKTGREFWEQARPDNDYVFFMRAGYTGSWRYASVMWNGDSNMNWEKYDGIPSTIPSVNSVGISGMPITSTDIAGYHCLVSLPTDKELFFRWTQLGAMLPVMRTHASSGCAGNWLFDSDRETLLHFKKYAELHTALFPYFYTLAHQAAAKGYPVVRHLMLHYPEDPGSRQEDYQFMIGDRILVAPVVQKHAREREVYFPPGEWVSWWDSKHYQGPARFKVSAPLEEIPVFVKAGTLVPLFDSQIDTLVKTNNPALKGWDDANRSMLVRFFGEGRDELTIWDGTRFDCSSLTRKCEVADAPVKRVYSFEFR